MYPMPGNAPWLTLGLGVLAVGGAVGVFRRGRQGERPLAGWALLCWLAPLLPMLALQMVGFHRLLLIGQVALGLLVAMALAHMRQVRPPRAARFAPYVLGVFLGGLALQQLSALQQRFPQDYRQDIAAQRAYRYLRQQPPGPVLVDAAFHPQITAYEAFLARGYRTHLRFQPHQVAYDYVLLYRPQPMVPLQRVQARGFRIVHTTPQAWVLARQQAP
jgi:hypothetical protein